MCGAYLLGFVALHTTNIFCLTNGSNHWRLRQPEQVSKTETMARGTKVPFAATSNRLPSHPTRDGRATQLFRIFCLSCVQYVFVIVVICVHS